MRLTRRWLIVVVVVVMIPILCIRVYRQVIPAGARLFPFWFASDEGPGQESPDGRRVVRVFFNDAGAAHSGNHWTWLVVDHWLTGKRVIAEGYSVSQVRFQKAPFPMRWSDDRTFSVDFVGRRYEDTKSKPVIVQLP